MIVYKYVHPDRIDVLENGLIRFTQPAALNDPFDLRPSLREFRRFFDRLHRSSPGEPPTADDLNQTQQFISQTFDQLHESNSRDLVFLSLTKNRNNLLMWSHYCDCHRGFVIGFESRNPFFGVPQSGIKSVLRDVSYSRSRPVFPTRDQDIDRFFKQNISVLTKSHHWKYEEELRMCASQSAASETKQGPDGQPIYLFKFPPDAVSEVILGYRTSTENRQAISSLVSRKYPRATISEAALNESEYDLDIVPYFEI